MNNKIIHRISMVLNKKKLVVEIIVQRFYDYRMKIVYMSLESLSHAINKLPTGKRLEERVFGHPFLQSPVDNL